MIAAITEAAVAMHRAFHAERRLVELNICPCDSCTQTRGLRLKFVAHVGEVATQTIKRRRKLAGIDVIFVHRLLKNPVHVPEYVLLSEDLYRSGSTFPTDLPVHEILAGPRGNRTRAHLLRRCRGPPRSPRFGAGPHLAPTRWRDGWHPWPGPAVHASPATPTCYRFRPLIAVQ